MRIVITSRSDWWFRLSKEEKRKYIEEHPNSKYAKLNKFGETSKKKIKNAAKETKKKTIKKIARTKYASKQNIKAVKNVLNPSIESTEKDKEKAKKLAITLARVALASIVVASAVSGLAPISKTLAEEFGEFILKGNTSSSMVALGNDTTNIKDEDVIPFLYDMFLEFLENKLGK